MANPKSLAVLGAGKLGETLIRGLLEAGVIKAADVTVTAGHPERVEQLRGQLGVRGTLSNSDAARSAEIVVLSVKPQTVRGVLADVRGVLQPTQLLISVAASVSTTFI